MAEQATVRYWAPAETLVLEADMVPPVVTRFQGEAAAAAACVQREEKEARVRSVEAVEAAAHTPAEEVVMEAALQATQAGTAETVAALQAPEAVAVPDWVPRYSTTEAR